MFLAKKVVHEYNISNIVYIFYHYKMNFLGPTWLYGYRSCFFFQVDKWHDQMPYPKNGLIGRR